jgi:hypothetical protein
MLSWIVFDLATSCCVLCLVLTDIKYFRLWIKSTRDRIHEATMLTNLGPRHVLILRRRVWRYQRGNQNPYIDEEQTMQWSKAKVQKDNQRSTKHKHKSTDRVTQTSIKTGGVLRCSGRVRSSCSNSGTHRVNLATIPVINEEEDRKVITTSGTYPWLFMTQIFHSG